MTTGRVSKLLLFTLLLASPLVAESRQEQKLRVAREVYLDLFDVPERSVPEALLDDANCVVVVPNVIKGAFGWGGRHGRGVASCRNDNGDWSPPIFVKLSGASFGLQIGGESSDLVFFLMTERGARSLLKTKFTLGGDLSLAAGPLGRSAGAVTDLKLKAEIYAYAKSRGLFAGISMEGARMAPDQKWIDRFYGRRLWPDEVLFEHQVPTLPQSADRFISALP